MRQRYASKGEGPEELAGSTTGTEERVLRAPRADAHDDRTAQGLGLPYLPGLDGLRALAVVAVLLYHADLGFMRGGFLGVEVFFVISGYLITALLLSEKRERGRVNLAAFWIRRARRLLPALYLVIVATLVFAVAFLPEEVAGLRDDALAAFGYVTNWYLIFGNESYFEAVGRPSLLQHLWSLAVEEQFYLIWPLLFAALIGVVASGRWKRRRSLLPILLAGAAGSALLMAALYQPDADPSRLYYGTDTRASGLLIGAALALLWAPEKGSERSPNRPSRAGRFAPLLLDAAGLVALCGLILLCLLLRETQPFLYQGGFMVVGLVTAAVIAVSVHPRARLLGAGLLGRQPLRWIGLRSYGIYLWHWPVFMVTRPGLDVPIDDGLPLLFARLAATVALAELSYRFVETPIRTGALGRAWRSLREARGGRRWRLRVRWAGVTATGAAFCLALGVAVALAEPPAPPSYLSVESVHTEAPVAAAPETISTETVANETTQAPVEKATTGATTGVAPPATDAPAGNPVVAVGDSVMIGAFGELDGSINNLAMQADVGMQAAGAIEILQKRRAAGTLGDVVIVHMGSNGVFTVEQFDEIMSILEDVRRVVFVNVKAPRPWEGSNNEMLADGVRRYPNAVLADWHAASANRPELFVEDGIHLQTEGQQLYTGLILSSAGLEGASTENDEEPGPPSS